MSDSLDIEEFPEDKTPTYAILSHTWEDGEVSYEEWENHRWFSSWMPISLPSWILKKPAGFVKIEGTANWSGSTISAGLGLIRIASTKGDQPS